MQVDRETLIFAEKVVQEERLLKLWHACSRTWPFTDAQLRLNFSISPALINIRSFSDALVRMVDLGKSKPFD
jgi:hypothetical protein